MEAAASGALTGEGVVLGRERRHGEGGRVCVEDGRCACGCRRRVGKGVPAATATARLSRQTVTGVGTGARWRGLHGMDNPASSSGCDGDVPHDLYGFTLRNLTAADAAARAACDAAQLLPSRAWPRGWLGRADWLWPSIRSLKHRIRSVRLPPQPPRSATLDALLWEPRPWWWRVGARTQGDLSQPAGETSIHENLTRDRPCQPPA